ncbi:MAG: hypothetical protein IH991_20010 [Planctomycetes bacterium]|nr:hypothetical protein [Planctomycetota bacterium]
MKRLLLLMAVGLGTAIAMSATAPTASADHCSSGYSPRYSSSYRSYRPYGYTRSYHSPSRYYGSHSPYYHSHGYRPYGNSFGVYGRNFSFRIGF